MVKIRWSGRSKQKDLNDQGGSFYGSEQVERLLLTVTWSLESCNVSFELFEHVDETWRWGDPVLDREAHSMCLSIVLSQVTQVEVGKRETERVSGERFLKCFVSTQLHSFWTVTYVVGILSENDHLHSRESTGVKSAEDILLGGEDFLRLAFLRNELC